MKDCCPIETTGHQSKSYRTVLWIALVLNAVMFAVELGASFVADSVSLQADSMDFLGDSGNYAISLFVLSLGVRTRAYSSVLKAFTMAVFAIGVLGTTLYYYFTKATPEPNTMTALGITALLVNLSVAMMLYKFRNGDSNMRSVWICTRNDVIGNVLVIFAAIGVSYTNTSWPDLAVASVMAVLAISGSVEVFKQAKLELIEAKID